MLASFIHKENNDLSSKPTKLPPGKSQKNARNKKRRAIEEECSVVKLDPLVALNSQERYGEVHHQIKKA